MKKRLLFILIFLIIGLIFVFGITSPKNNNRVYTSFINIKGEGVIDDKKPNYFNKDNYVYFKMYNYFYIAKLLEVNNNKEEYEMLYYLKKDEYKDYINYMYNDNYLYLISNNKIGIYNLKKNNKKIKKFNNIKVLGIKDNNIYIEESNKIYKYNELLNKKDLVKEIPNINKVNKIKY